MTTGSTKHTGHTPGPWAVNFLTAQVDAFTASGALAVCQLLWPTDERSEAETEANARLIAAAPDLLAALNGFVLNERQLNDEHFAGVQERLMVLARAAISKATGGQP